MTCTDFRTTFPLPRAPFTLAPERGELLLLGSCFTDEIGARLQACGYPCSPNPCGVQYNPASIAALLRCALAGEIEDSLFFEHEGRWRCWLMPTRFSSSDREECIRICHDALKALTDSLQHAEALIITLGTAWIYEHIAEGYRGIVSNCHKVPATRFSRRRMSVQEIADEWRTLVDALHRFNPALKLIFTVSPIRHFKDGAHENTLSKATLQLAIADLLESGLPLAADYFPAYELLMDDLRDYRFYAADMLHPSPVAVDYIWTRFTETYFTPATREARRTEAARLRRLAHRPLLD